MKEPLPKLRRGRVARMLTVLARVPDDEFNMDVWCRDTGCGTVACAAGHAATDPVLQKQGLHLVPYGFSRRLTPAFQGMTHDEAIKAFFGLTSKETRRLFMPSRYSRRTIIDPIARQRVIARIERLLERDRAGTRSGR